VTIHGEFVRPPEIDSGLATAALTVIGHRHEVVHLLYAATDEHDALARIGGLLSIDGATIARVLDQPLRWMLPQFRTELASIAALPMGEFAATVSAARDALGNAPAGLAPTGDAQSTVDPTAKRRRRFGR
jgi:hypothetical protein